MKYERGTMKLRRIVFQFIVHTSVIDHELARHALGVLPCRSRSLRGARSAKPALLMLAAYPLFRPNWFCPF